jgi:hypothetical protein
VVPQISASFQRGSNFLHYFNPISLRVQHAQSNRARAGLISVNLLSTVSMLYFVVPSTSPFFLYARGSVSFMFFTLYFIVKNHNLQ